MEKIPLHGNRYKMNFFNKYILLLINKCLIAQRYFTNDKFYKPGGPVFLMIGGEGEATPIWMVQGAWIQYAKEFNALCFQLEHRYYGKSKPTEYVKDMILVC